MATFDRDKAREALIEIGVFGDDYAGAGQPTVTDVLDALEECVEPDGWNAIMRILGTYYPESIFPQRSVDADRGNGPQVVALLRLLNESEAKLRRIRASLDAYLEHRQSIENLAVSVGVILGPPAVETS